MNKQTIAYNSYVTDLHILVRELCDILVNGDLDI